MPPSRTLSDGPVLVGIAGGTGSGKTTVATRIVEAMPPGAALLIQQDSYYLTAAT
jgi:uridine kinase